MPRAGPIKTYRKPLFSHHRHTARVLPHAHTSYPLLLLLLVVVGALLWVMAPPAGAADTVEVTGVVSTGPVPPVAAVILSPKTDTRFDAMPIPVTGTCPAGFILKLYRNDIFSGSTLCASDGTFQLTTDLFHGRNDLQIRIFNAGNQEGPRSNIVSVYYQTDPFDSNPFYITTEIFYRAAFYDQSAEWEFFIIGGQEPFDITVVWGDGYSSTLTAYGKRSFRLRHTYTSGPSARNYYPVSVSATDKNGRKASLQVFNIISARTIPGTATKFYFLQSLYDDGWLRKMLLAWTAYGVVVLMVLSFWVGEKRAVALGRRGVLAGRNL